MNKSCRLSNVTQNYLHTFDCILDEMIRKMTEAELTSSISHNFIVQMIPHHCAAIEMSRNLLQYTTDIPLQDIAENIIREQTMSIENMQEILCGCKKCMNSAQAICRYQEQMDQIMQTMFHKMRQICADNDINNNFIREMIPHHEGAIHMAKTTLRHDICPELVSVLRQIIISQKNGVAEMEQLLQHTKC